MYPIDIHVVDDEDRCIVFLPESFNLFYVAKDLGAILKFYENISKDLRLIVLCRINLYSKNIKL